MPHDPHSATGQHAPWERFGWVMGTIWLVFLFFPVTALLEAPVSTAATVVALIVLALFAVIYVYGFVRLYRPSQPPPSQRMANAILAILIALAVIVGLFVGVGVLGMVSYLVAYSMFSQPLRRAFVFALFWLLLTAALLVITGTFGQLWFFVLIVLLVAVVTAMVRLIDSRQEEHLRTRQELDLVAERERVARDVHDVLGHSLTVITMKSQLAERLIDADPQAAKDELAQIQSMTRESLAEIRATVAGLRVARLGEELDNTRRALHDAGITAEVPADPEAVDPRHRLVLAWVLREAITNVVRHSGAGQCTVKLAAHCLVVTDDGVGPGAAEDVTGRSRNGQGIRGAGERVQASGGTLTVTSPPEGGTRVEVRW